MKPRQKTKVKNEIADFILDQIELTTSAGASPVTGEELKELSKAYREFKKSKGKGTDADLHLNNKMISSIQSKIKSDGIEFKITNKTEKLKSFNHNKGDTLPKRPFLPDDSKKGKFGTFNKEIRDGVNEIIRNFKRASKNQD